MKYHIFGEYRQWAISEDDGCLRFHPQFNSSPEKKSSWIWKEAFEEVVRLGGFDNVLHMLRCSEEQTNSDDSESYKRRCHQKEQIVKDYMERHGITLEDLGFDDEVTLDRANEDMLDSIMDDIRERG